MKHPACTLPLRTIAPFACAAFLLSALLPFRVEAAERIWDGGGPDGNWQTGLNWDTDTAPSAGDSLIFTGNVQLNPFNDFVSGTLFNGITFRNPSGSFVLDGNPVALGGNLTDTQSGLIQTVQLALDLKVSPTVYVGTGGVLALNGVVSGPGFGITKRGFGGLMLSAANTYSGPTVIKDGYVLLDFTQPSSPLDNVISSASPLVLGGVNVDRLATNFAALVMIGKDETVNSQSFNGTTTDIGASVIWATSGNGNAVANLHLGGLTHQPGGVLTLVAAEGIGYPPAITTFSTNVNGILGGWATVGSGQSLFGMFIGRNFASVDPDGNIIDFNNYLVYQTGALLSGSITTPTNLLIDSTSVGDVRVDVDSAGTTTDVNAINVRRLEFGGGPFSIVIGTNNTLRLGKYGAIFKSDLTPATVWTLGQSAGGAIGIQNVGTLTAGGAPDADGEIVLHLNSTSQTQGSLNVEAAVTDNGNGRVTVVKAGPGSLKMRGHNTFSGGLYVLQGRLQLAGSELASTGGTPNPDGAGTGPIFVFPGSYFFPSGLLGGTISNAMFIAGIGNQPEPLGAIRMGNANVAGPITLIGDATIGGSGGVVGGPISGPYALSLCSAATIASTVTLSNSLNDWTGGTTIQARNAAVLNTFISGVDEVIPHGPGKGNVTMRGFSNGRINWNLNGHNETINGLSTAGTGLSCTILNSVPGTTSTLVVGDNDATGFFGGVIRDGAAVGAGGIVALEKVGTGFQFLFGTNSYTGDTTVSGGTLALFGPASVPASPNITVAAGATLDVSGGPGGTLNLASGQTLRGGGTIGGSLAMNPGAIVSPGASVGTLTVTEGAAFQGTIDMELDKTAGTNDQIRAGSIVYGGTLNLASVSGPLQGGESFKLFDAGSYAGAFDAIVPATPGFRMEWDLSRLAIDGTLGVIFLNVPPVADASATEPVVISPNNVNATAILDGTRSTDSDGDPLQYAWFVAGASGPVATGAVATVTLPVGANAVTLVVTDGHDSASNTVTVHVLTAAQAIEELAAVVEAEVTRSKPLLATLNAAAASSDRGNFHTTINQLHAFQNKVRAQVSPPLAEALIAHAQVLIDVLSGP